MIFVKIYHAKSYVVLNDIQNIANFMQTTKDARLKIKKEKSRQECNRYNLVEEFGHHMEL